MSNGDLQSALAEVLSQFGRRIVDRPAQLRAALVDTLGKDAASAQSEIDAAVAASATGVASALRDADPASPAGDEQIREWFDRLVASGLSLRDAALATSSWAAALDSSETARRSSEVAATLEAPDRPEPTDQVLSEPAPPPDPGERTLLGADDLTEVPGGAERPAPPSGPAPVRRAGWPPPVGAPVLPAVAHPDRSGAAAPRSAEPAGRDSEHVRPAAAVLSAAPPVGPPVLPASASRPGRRLPRWVPIAAGAAAVVLVAAIAVPLLVTAVGSSADADRAFLRSDLDQFLLTEAEYEAVAPGADVVGAATDDDDGRYKAEDNSPWEIPSPRACESLLLRIPPGDPETSSPARTSSAATTDSFLLSSARWYETEGEASRAFKDMYPLASSCGSVDILIEGDEYSADLVVRSEEDQAFADLLTMGDVRLARACYQRVNVVACYYADDTAIANDVGDENHEYWAAAARRAENAEPSREEG